jgi:hypothetical protein
MELTLTSPSGMGGLIGAGGYDFQERFIAYRLPKWIHSLDFIHLVNEGTGDVDVRFDSRRIHVQVKNHNITPAEFKEIIKTFHGFDRSKVGSYQEFILAAPSFSKDLQPILSSLVRIRNMQPFYDGEKDVGPEKADLRKRLSELGLTNEADFVFEKVFFDEASVILERDEVAAAMFARELQKFQPYSEFTGKECDRAFSAILRKLGAERGRPIDRRVFEGTIADALASKSGKPDAILLDVHNWTSEVYAPAANHVLDWSEYFDRAERKVPDAAKWKETLLPKLRQLATEVQRNTSTRRIELRGKCCLSTGIAIGATFPDVGSWHFEIPQTNQASWTSNSVPNRSYPAIFTETDGEAQADAIAFVLNVTSGIGRDVGKFLSRAGIRIKAVVEIAPRIGPASLAISGSEEAVAFAYAARDSLKAALAKHDVSETHLFFCGPFGLSVFIGQKLTSIGLVHVYEYQNPGYIHAFTLKT